MPKLDMQVELVVASGKGGVGKSTLASSLALVLAEKGFRLVAADADAEAPNLHLALGIRSWDEEEPYYEGRIAYILDSECTRCDLCRRECPFGAIDIVDGRYVVNEYICEGCFTCSLVCPVKAVRYHWRIEAGRIRVSYTSYGFPLVSSEIMPGRPNSGKLVTEVKNRAKKLLGGRGVVLIDAAAGIGCQVISSLAGAHAAILVAEPTPASFSDLKRIHKITKHFGIATALVVNKYDLNPSYAEKIIEYARSENIDYLGSIPYDDTVPRALARLAPLILEYPDAPAAKAIRGIGEKVASILENFREWRRRFRPRKIEPYVPIVIKPDSIKN